MLRPTTRAGPKLKGTVPLRLIVQLIRRGDRDWTCDCHMDMQNMLGLYAHKSRRLFKNVLPPL